MRGELRRIAANCDELRRIAGVGPLKTTNTLQTGKEHSNTPQRAEGTVADTYTYTCTYTYTNTCTNADAYANTYIRHRASGTLRRVRMLSVCLEGVGRF